MTDADIFVPRTELEQRFVALETRIGKVEKVTTDMATQQSVMLETFAANTVKLNHIYDWVTKANGVWGFVRRHGPKIGYLFVGVAISRGWVTAENGHNILSVFGIGG